MPRQAELSTRVQAPALWEAVEGGKWAGCGERQTLRSSAGLSLRQRCPDPDVTHTTPNSSHDTQGALGAPGNTVQSLRKLGTAPHSPPQALPVLQTLTDFPLSQYCFA